MKRSSSLTISVCVALLLVLNSHEASALTLSFADADFKPARQATVVAAPTSTGHSVTTSVSSAPVSGSSPSGNYIDNVVASGSSGQNFEGFSFDSTMVFNQFAATVNYSAIPEPGVASVLLMSVLFICSLRRRRW